MTTENICGNCGHGIHLHNLNGNGTTHFGTPRKYKVVCEAFIGGKRCPCKKFQPKKIEQENRK